MWEWRHQLVEACNALLRPLGAQILRTEELERLKGIASRFFPVRGLSFQESPLPEGAETYLSSDNPRLLEIRKRYEALPCPATRHSIWRTQPSSINLRYFRGDNPYVYQFLQGNSALAHIVTAYYMKTVDSLGLLDHLKEDGMFGVYTFLFDDQLVVSRDLLDSINEIVFLEETLGVSKLPGLNVLDIGAGYGRLAYRMASAIPSVSNYICVDAIPESSFLCEYYLNYRGVAPRARAVLLDEIEEVLARVSVQLAINVHSFPECTMEAIDWWLGLLQKNRVQYLMIVPNHGTAFLSYELNRERLDFRPLLESHRYRLVSARPKYKNRALQQYGVSPEAHYHLFELSV